MQKINTFKISVVLVVILTFFNCSSDDDYPLVLHPPDWIIGKWIKTNDSDTLNSITFTENNSISEFSHGGVRNFSEFIYNNDDQPTFTEEITDDLYKVTLFFPFDGDEYNFIAIRISDNEILYNDKSYIRE
ncbi:MAG: hypothetical protein WD512_16970 [Candidatus Paceibacterota bacterium]